MKKIKELVFVLAACFTISGLNAQEVLTGTGSEKQDGPVLEIDKEVHDYGKVDKGGNGTCVFTVTNSGNAPLILSNCKGSCGCTVPACSKEPIAPGQSTEIKVKYDTNRVGPINKSVTITSNAVNEPSKRIRITGNVVEVKKADPQG